MLVPRRVWCSRRLLIAGIFQMGGIPALAPSYRGQPGGKVSTRLNEHGISLTRLRSIWPVCVSHILMVLSRDAVATNAPGLVERSVFCRTVSLCAIVMQNRNPLVDLPILGWMRRLSEERRRRSRQHYHALGTPFSFHQLTDPIVGQSTSVISDFPKPCWIKTDLVVRTADN